MFKYTIDEKKQITDYKGNQIVDLCKNVFSKGAQIRDYKIVRMSDMFHMRPDLVSQAMYNDDQFAEFILKFSGISNPFTLDDDDVLMIPNEEQAVGMMAANNENEAGNDSDGVIAQIQNFYKFVNQEYKSDKTSYDNLKNKDIPSGVLSPETTSGSYMVPYISEDGRTAVTIRNGRMYFGEDTGLNIATQSNGLNNDATTKSVQSILNDAMTSLSDKNCIYNGTSLADFIRSNYNSNR